MNLSEKRFSLKRASSRNQITVGLSGRSAVLAVAIMGWCAAIQGAEIHEVVEFLLASGATEDIYAAVILGHVDKVAAFLKQDKKLVNARDSGGKAPLHWAALYGQKKVMELLLAEKADVNLLDGDGFTPLHWATTFNKRDAVELLLANKADMNIKVQKYGWTPLRLAVIHGHMASAEALLNGGADPNVKDEQNIPLLHQAVIRGKKEMVELLLDKKADMNNKDSAGDTALDADVE